MLYCTKCLQPDTRPNINFSKDGICPACKYHESLQDVDWNDRYLILLELLEKFKEEKHEDQIFDCIIGVSGGKDSTRQALWVRDQLGLKPLLVCLSYPPEQVTELGVNNLSNLINLGFDVIISSVAPKTWKKILQEGFFNFTNWAKGSELALFSSVPQIAIKHKIKLIFWGENPALQLGDLKTANKLGYDGNNLKNMNTLQGGDLTWLANTNLSEQNLIPFKYPSSREFSQNGIQIVYLGWFWKDWSLIDNAMYSSIKGLQLRQGKVKDKGDFYGISALDENWVIFNQVIKFYKFGFGKITDFVNEQIRDNKITREEAIELVEKFDDAYSEEHISSFCEYLDISKEIFWKQIYKSINLKLFVVKRDGQINKKFKVGVGL